MGPPLAMFSGHRAYLGWPAHERLWRANLGEVENRRRQVDQFYSGKMANPRKWPAGNQIDFVLWTRGDFPPPPGAFERISREIEADYEWSPAGGDAAGPVGLWRRGR